MPAMPNSKQAKAMLMMVFFDIFFKKNLGTLFVYNLSLLIHYVVIREDMLSS